MFGAWAHVRHDRQSFAYFAPFIATVTVVLIFYLNFRYGASQADAAFCRSPDPSPCEVRDRDYFFLWSFSALSVWIALGMSTLWQSVLSALAMREVRPMRIATASCVAALVLIPALGNYDASTRHNDRDTAAWARDLLNSVEPYGILVTAGDNDMFPLWYAQEVEGIRRDVVLANTSLLNTQWFVRQLIRRPGFTYDADTGPALYKGKQWTKPSHPVLAMNFDEADSVPDWTQITQPMQFESGELRAVVSPRILTRADWFVYRLIKDNPDRPVHFARSTADYASAMGFDDNVYTHGLTRKLSRTKIAETDTMKRVQFDGWMDVGATSALWDSFEAPSALIEKDKWVDEPSISVPMAYVFTGYALTDSMLQRGDTAAAARVFDRVRGVASAIGRGDLFPTAALPSATLGDTAVGPRPLPRGR
jgi:hypothetical protein